MLAPIPRLEDYDISSVNGFLPDELPLEVLPDPYYSPWEGIIRNLQGLILSRKLRSVINGTKTLSTSHLSSEPEWRRAYSILAFLSHAYIWGGDCPAEVVPPSISAPFLSTCRHLDLPPVATYAGVALWNFKPLCEDEPIDLENLSTLTTFTGSMDESWFYLVSVAIEAQGAPIISIMLDAIAAARANDSLHVTLCLQRFAEHLEDLSTILVRMYSSCDPHVFYHRIRPFLAGSKNMAEAGLPEGVRFEDGTGTQPYVQFAGGSNAQSSLIQFFDIALGIEHRPTGERPRVESSASDSEGQGPPPPSQHFIKEMRKYMPGAHRRFLEDVSRVANIRDYVEAHRRDKSLSTAFDACLAMLRDFRDKHIQMVSRYIIVKSRESRSHSRSLSPREAPSQPSFGLAKASSRKDHGPKNGGKKLKGTGGTALIPFLKQARDETGDPAIGSWARRLLTNAPPDAVGFAPLGGVNEHANGKVEIVGLAGTWSVDDSEGGICHW
ncbi:MAG: hypothetical protein M1828_006532 [Chrysothrix sp. TS-e1954]|nr:MAG: hypothetical protein M1828_006532 [Chrysothrix sp. TS-e1954]